MEIVINNNGLELELGTTEVYPILQEKQVTPTKEVQEVIADEGIYGLSKVIVDKVKLQDKEVNPSTTKQVVNADNEYTGLNDVIVNAVATEEKTVIPTKEEQIITPSEDKFLSKVIVNGDNNLVPENISEGKSIFGVEGSGKIESEWTPESDWWDIEQILKDDTEDYKYKYIILMDDTEPTYTVSSYTMGDLIKTSDGYTYTRNDAGKVHTWDTSKDKWCSKGYYTRYILSCSNSLGGNYFKPYATNVSSIYLVFSGFEQQDFGSSTRLIAIKPINGARIKDFTGVPGTSGNYGLTRIYQDVIPITDASLGAYFSGRYCPIDFSKNQFDFQQRNVNCNNAFGNPFLKLPKTNFTTLYVGNGNSMFSAHYSIEEIPKWINFDNITNANSLFSACYHLRKVHNRINMANLTSAPTNMLYNCYDVREIYFSNVSLTLDVSYASKMRIECLLDLFDNLVDLTGGTAQTLKIGNINKQKLEAITEGQEALALAVAKNWTVS